MTRDVAGIDATKIKQGIAKGKSAQDILLSEDARAIEASATVVAAVYNQVREGIEDLTYSLGHHNVRARKPINESVESFAASLTARSSENIEATLYQLDLGHPSRQHFHFRVQCIAFIPSLRSHMNAPRLPGSSNILCLYLQRYANLTRISFPHLTRVVTVEKDGTLTLRSEQMLLIEKTDVAKLVAMIKDWIESPDPWEIIQRDR